MSHPRHNIWGGEKKPEKYPNKQNTEKQMFSEGKGYDKTDFGQMS